MPRRKPTTAAAAAALPLDVRLMNHVAALVFALAALALAGAAARWAARAPLFNLRALVLESAEPGAAPLRRANLATLRANALPRVAGHLMAVDLEAARAAFESVPWVRRATVRRVWPNKLAVTLEEHEAAALWQGEDKRAERLVNRHGEIFEANLGDVEDEGLPTLAGPDARAALALQMLARLDTALAPLGDTVAHLALSGRGSWRAELDSGATLELGRGSEAEVVVRVERFARTLAAVAARYPTGGAPRAVLAADLRHPDGYALRLAGITTAATK